VALVVAGHHVALLFAGRALAGVSNGAAFSAGTAWLRELSRPPLGTATEQGAARRAAVAMTSGFALGPVASGLLAQWAPDAGVVPYLPHLVLAAGVLPLIRAAPDTVSGGEPAPLTLALPAIRSRRFRTVVAPMAPWVFAAPAIAFALLPSVVGAARHADGVALTAAISSLTALAGVLIQPLGKRLDTGRQANLAATTGLLVAVAGLALAAFTAHAQETWLLVPNSIVLGCAYGLCLVAGLVEVQRLADARAAGGLTAIYYTLTYLGFASPYLLSLAAHLASYTLLLAITAGLALTSGAIVTRQGARLGRAVN